MVTFNINMLVLVALSALLLSQEVYSQFFCPIGQIRDPETQLCITILRGGPGGRWRNSFGTKPAPLCPPGETWVASWGTCIPYIRGGPGGRWKSGPGGRWRSGPGGRWRNSFGTKPAPLCPPGETWVASWGTCIPYIRGGPGGRWKSGPGGRWRTGNLLPTTKPFPFDLGPVCPPGDIWVEDFQSCVPWLRGGPGGRWRSGPGGRWRGRQCPPGTIWGPGFEECIPYRPTLYSDDTCHRCWG